MSPGAMPSSSSSSADGREDAGCGRTGDVGRLDVAAADVEVARILEDVFAASLHDEVIVGGHNRHAHTERTGERVSPVDGRQLGIAQVGPDEFAVVGRTKVEPERMITGRPAEEAGHRAGEEVASAQGGFELRCAPGFGDQTGDFGRGGEGRIRPAGRDRVLGKTAGQKNIERERHPRESPPAPVGAARALRREPW